MPCFYLKLLHSHTDRVQPRDIQSTVSEHGEVRNKDPPRVRESERSQRNPEESVSG